jgi:nitroreductase
MEFDKVVTERRSVRAFTSETVPEQMIRSLIEAARLAPSGSNLQPLRYVVARTPEAVAAVAQCTSVAFVAKAPVVIACLIDMDFMAGRPPVDAGTTAQSRAFAEYDNRRRQWSAEEKRAYLLLNAGIAIEHIVLKAVDLGLGSCWIRIFDQAKLVETLALESRYEVAALLPVGWPAEHPTMRQRLALENLIIKGF